MKALAIVSGGMDSITMLYNFQHEIGRVLSFHYGSRHNEKELPLAKKHAERLGLPHEVVSLEFVGRAFKSALLASSESAIPDGHYADPVMKQTVVPFRNGIMLSIAAGYAESQELDTVMYASHFGDHAIYPDCRKDFVDAMGQAIERGTYAGIKLLAPYGAKTKRDIALVGRELGIDYQETWSCYKGDSRHCGICGTCVERREALDGFDTTEYQASEEVTHGL